MEILKEDRKRGVIRALMTRIPGRFSSELGLALDRRREKDLFLWFLASLLYGARISGTIVIHTHREFVRHRLVTPRRILDAAWEGIVDRLDAGGYARYDFKTATKLQEVMRNLVAQYGGDLNRLHRAASDPRDLEGRLKALGKGIGDVTVQIFLRELRGVWPKAEPPLSPLALLAADHLGLWKTRKSRGEIEALKACWKRSGVRRRRFSDFESALTRLGRDYCRRGAWRRCPLREYARVSHSPPLVAGNLQYCFSKRPL